MITRVLMETLVTRELDAAACAWERELGWEITARGAVDPPLSGLWSVGALSSPRFALVASPGSSRGFLRLVEGSEDDQSAAFDRPGLFNAELLCADVERLHASLGSSRAFRPVSSVNTYDLGATGGAVSKSFAARGPGGSGVFFTTYVSVPAPRQLPRCDHLVGPMFNSAVAVDDVAGMVSFYEGVLGMGRRFEMRIEQPSVNRILGLPEDWGFLMVVYKGEGDGLVELDVHDRPLPGAAATGQGGLKPGNSVLTLETTDLDRVMARAAERGTTLSAPRSIGLPPYDGRRVGLLVGPAGERVEVVECAP